MKHTILFSLFAVASAEGNHMRDDDTDSLVHCVDCPEYVSLSAKDKEAVLWSKVVSDEYQPGETERECDSYLALHIKRLAIAMGKLNLATMANGQITTECEDQLLVEIKQFSDLVR